MKDVDCVTFLQWLLPKLQMRWPGFRKVRRQVCKRIQGRLVELGLSDVAAYQEWIVAHPEELHILDGLCRITISRFYRDRGVFNYLRDDVLPELAQKAAANGRNVRCWSAGCASGEEPYTVNIIWKLAVSPNVPDVTLQIIATDSDPQMLERASRGIFGGCGCSRASHSAETHLMADSNATTATTTTCAGYFETLSSDLV